MQCARQRSLESDAMAGCDESRSHRAPNQPGRQWHRGGSPYVGARHGIGAVKMPLPEQSRCETLRRPSDSRRAASAALSALSSDALGGGGGGGAVAPARVLPGRGGLYTYA